MTTIEKMQDFVNGYGIGMTKQDLVSELYWYLKEQGHEVCVLNDKYLIVDGTDYQFIKSNKTRSWIVKTW